MILTRVTPLLLGLVASAALADQPPASADLPGQVQALRADVDKLRSELDALKSYVGAPGAPPAGQALSSAAGAPSPAQVGKPEQAVNLKPGWVVRVSNHDSGAEFGVLISSSPNISLAQAKKAGIAYAGKVRIEAQGFWKVQENGKNGLRMLISSPSACTGTIELEGKTVATARDRDYKTLVVANVDLAPGMYATRLIADCVADHDTAFDIAVRGPNDMNFLAPSDQAFFHKEK